MFCIIIVINDHYSENDSENMHMSLKCLQDFFLPILQHLLMQCSLPISHMLLHDFSNKNRIYILYGENEKAHAQPCNLLLQNKYGYL